MFYCVLGREKYRISLLYQVIVFPLTIIKSVMSVSQLLKNGIEVRLKANKVTIGKHERVMAPKF